MEYSHPINYGTPVDSYPQYPIESQPIESAPVIDPAIPSIDGGGTVPAPGPDPIPEVDATRFDAVLDIQVPADAIVFVNGQRTQTPGENRSYVSRNLKPGFKYSYELKVELERNGKTETQTKVIDLRAGDSKQLVFDFQPADTLVTSLTVNVPADAQVTLGGVKTQAIGTTRTFSTTKLKNGESWSEYDIVVTIEREGEQLSKTKTLDIKAGDSLTVGFDFDSTESEVASR